MTELRTERFVLRPLTEADATPTYLGWLRDPVAEKYIQASATTHELEDLRSYIRARQNREDVLFLGIFEPESGRHIGNIKFEPIDEAAGYAVMGILIGDVQWRGQKVTPEVLRATGAWLREHRQIRQMVLGVSASNTAAIRAYEAVGFIKAASPWLPISDETSLSMVWEL